MCRGDGNASLMKTGPVQGDEQLLCGADVLSVTATQQHPLPGIRCSSSPYSNTCDTIKGPLTKVMQPLQAADSAAGGWLPQQPCMLSEYMGHFAAPWWLAQSGPFAPRKPLLQSCPLTSLPAAWQGVPGV